MAFYKILDII